MNEKKKKGLPKVFGALFLVLLSGCGNSVEVRSDLASFAEGFSLSECLSTYKKGSFSYTMSLLKSGEEEGAHTDRISFERNQTGAFSYHREKTTSGSLVNSANLAKETIDYRAQADGSYLFSSQKDETQTSSSVDEAAVGKIIDTFFYAKEEGGKYTGGFYYGDDLSLRWSYQKYMRVDSAKNLLIYQLDDYVDNSATTSLYYEVNALGMCLSWRQSVVQGSQKLVASYQVTI